MTGHELSPNPFDSRFDFSEYNLRRVELFLKQVEALDIETFIHTLGCKNIQKVFLFKETFWKVYDNFMARWKYFSVEEERLTEFEDELEESIDGEKHNDERYVSSYTKMMEEEEKTLRYLHKLKSEGCKLPKPFKYSYFNVQTGREEMRETSELDEVIQYSLLNYFEDKYFIECPVDKVNIREIARRMVAFKDKVMKVCEEYIENTDTISEIDFKCISKPLAEFVNKWKLFSVQFDAQMMEQFLNLNSTKEEFPFKPKIKGYALFRAVAQLENLSTQNQRDVWLNKAIKHYGLESIDKYHKNNYLSSERNIKGGNVSVAKFHEDLCCILK